MRNSRVSKNDRAWSKLIAETPEILREVETSGFVDLTAKEIKPYREPRLATKFDFKEDVPNSLTCRNLSVLAVKNGVYRVATTDPFISLRHSIDILDPPVFRIPKHIRTLSVPEITSEAKALDVAQVAGILSDVFGEDKVHLVIRNREFCSAIEFQLPSLSARSSLLHYNASGVQIEVDGGYEGERALHLVEAKLANKRDNIAVRQLLYPHLHYRAKHPFMDIRSYLMFYDNLKAEYTFYRFHTDGDLSHRVDHDNARCYRLLDHENFDLLDELCHTPINHELIDLNAPFPQADRFATIYDIFMKLVRSKAHQLSTRQLFSDYKLDPRQHDYYGNTLVWMRLATKTDAKHYQATKIAKSIGMRMNRVETLLELAKIVVSNEVFSVAMRSHNENIPFESYRATLANLLRDERYRLKSDATIGRRTQTVKSWVEFLRRELRSF